MIEIKGSELNQWDTGRGVTVKGIEAEYVHFANQGDSKAVIVGLVDIDAPIPDFLLQTGRPLLVYAVKDCITLESKMFSVKKRPRPENYVYEDDQRNYIYELITNAEDAAEAANTAAGNATAATAGAIAATERTTTATENATAAAGNANAAAASANEAAFKAAHTAKNLMVVDTASGETIVLDDAIDQYLVGCRIFGETTQDGIPTPDAPVELVSVENPTIAVNEQSMLVPYTLHGIPVSSGGNYTANGQQWICDEVDFARGVYVQRIGRKALTGKENWGDGGSYFVLSYSITGSKAMGESFCSHFTIGLQSDSGKYFAGSVGFGFYHTSSSLTEWKAFLSNQSTNGTPVVLLYILTNPIETSLTEEEIAAYKTLYTTRGTTTITNDAGAYMEIQYVMDAKKYIDSLVGTSAGLVNATVE